MNTRKPTAMDGLPKPERGRGRNVPAPMPSIGPLLSERREAMGVTLAEAEVATRIRQKYLAAIERDEWDLLPGEVVGRGFLRNYATYLGLDPTEMIERRRAIADDSLAAVLANTSAASDLPPERKVDYRPKDVALKDEGDDIDSPRQLNPAPFLTVFVIVAVAILAVWGATQFGRQLGEMAAAAQRQAVVWQEQLTAAAAPQPTPTALAAVPTNAVAPVVADAAAGAATPADAPAVATPASAATAPVAVPADGASVDAQPTPQPSPTAEAPSLLGLLPTPTPLVIPTAAPAPPAAPTTATATVLQGANLRGGPSTDFGVVGTAQQGESVTLVGRSADGAWFQTEAGFWIFGQLLDNTPADLPVVETPAAPVVPAAEPPAQQG